MLLVQTGREYYTMIKSEDKSEPDIKSQHMLLHLRLINLGRIIQQLGAVENHSAIYYNECSSSIFSHFECGNLLSHNCDVQQQHQAYALLCLHPQTPPKKSG